MCAPASKRRSRSLNGVCGIFWLPNVAFRDYVGIISAAHPSLHGACCLLTSRLEAMAFFFLIFPFFLDFCA